MWGCYCRLSLPMPSESEVSSVDGALSQLAAQQEERAVDDRRLP